MEVKTLQLFNKAMVAYNLILTSIGGDNRSEDIALKEDGELLEGPALMWDGKAGYISSIISFTIYCSDSSMGSV